MIQSDTNGRNGISGLFGTLVGLGILAASVDIMRGALEKQKKAVNDRRNPYTQYRGLQNVSPTLRKTVPGVYREFPGAGTNYANRMDERLRRML